MLLVDVVIRYLYTAKILLHLLKSIPLTPHSKMFWSDVGLSPKIEVANLDGSDRKALVHSKLFWPTGLAIDTVTERLYWCDMKENEVETVFINGTDRRVVMTAEQLKGQFSEPFSIDVFEDYLYIVTKKGVAFKWNKFGHGYPVKLVNTVPGATIKIYHKVRQTNTKGKSRSLSMRGNMQVFNG